MPLERRTRLRSKSLKPRRQRLPRCKATPKPELHNSRCDRLPVAGTPWCKTHARLEIDYRVRLLIMERDQWTCQSGRDNHNGGPQWAHLITRGALSMRWNPWNSVCLCAGCHDFYTHRPNLWTLWMVERLGQERFWEMYRKSALPEGPPDYAELIRVIPESSTPR